MFSFQFLNRLLLQTEYDIEDRNILAIRAREKVTSTLSTQEIFWVTTNILDGWSV